jgi:bla regulator protein blaR1
MASQLLTILEITTVASSCGILLALLLRRPLRRLFGPSLAYLLWLLVPTSLVVLLLPAPTPGLKTVFPVPLSMPLLTAHGALASLSSGVDWAMWLLCTWGIGALLLSWRLARQQRRFMASLGLLVRSDEGVLRAAYPAGCPVVVGIMRPRIVVPSDFDTRYASDEQVLILAHERMHVRRGDLVMNALWAVARCIFWFNPLIHIAARLFRFDEELACDAAVMRNHPHSRRSYASAMLRTQLADDALPLGCHWPSTHPLKERIMLLKQPPDRGLRSAVGQVFVGACVLMVGYATWAVQPDAAAPGDKARAKFADSAIRISADHVQQSGDSFRYTGNVILEVLSGNKGLVKLSARRASDLSGDAAAEGDLKIDAKPRGDAPVSDRARKPMLLEGVQLELDGRTFTTERAIFAPPRLKTDTLEVLRNASSEAIPAR